MGEIAENYRKLRESIPEEVKIVVATKTRSPEEVREVIEAGATDIGENYAYPEAFNKYRMLENDSEKVTWHLIGHLQKNKINKALPIFDIIQTVESYRKAKHIDKRVERAGKSNIPVLLEINSGQEEDKYGFKPELPEVEEALEKIIELEHVRVEGLMTMGPFTGDPEDARPYFVKTRELFEDLKEKFKNRTDLKTLSMGMSNSYRIAIEEGATMVRIGSLIFGPRK